MKFSKKVLKNGLRLITVPMKDNPTATVLVLVEAGSKYEDKKINGLSHFLEHMCFKGTSRRPSRRTTQERATNDKRVCGVTKGVRNQARVKRSAHVPHAVCVGGAVVPVERSGRWKATGVARRVAHF